METLRAGIDVGSTTVKIVVINENDEEIYSVYRRHNAEQEETVKKLLKELKEKFRKLLLILKAQLILEVDAQFL